MTDYYRRVQPDSKLDTLTVQMISKRASAPPKLRGKAAEIRGLIGFGVEVAQRHLDPENPFESTVIHAASLLQALYAGLPAESFHHEAMAATSRRLCLLLVALESQAQPPMWRLKPKAHLMQEMLEFSKSRPSQGWLYRDEDFGGSIAAMAKHRGGHHGPHSAGAAILKKFAARHAVPSIS